MFDRLLLLVGMLLFVIAFFYITIHVGIIGSQFKDWLKDRVGKRRKFDG